MYVVHEAFIKVPLFQETSPAPKIFWLRALQGDKSGKMQQDSKQINVTVKLIMLKTMIIKIFFNN